MSFNTKMKRQLHIYQNFLWKNTGKRSIWRLARMTNVAPIIKGRRSLLSTLFILFSLTSEGQIENGYYMALERMCWRDNKGRIHCYDAPRKWYHENLAYVEGDSIFIYKMPIQIVGKQKIYSASDGAFYYYLGQFLNYRNDTVVRLIRYNCDYCGVRVKVDSATGFMFPQFQADSHRVHFAGTGFKIDTLQYKKLEKAPEEFPPKNYFYFDSNSIYRVDPKGQYKLMATGIKNFLQTKDLKLDNDTLRICLERRSLYGVVENLDKSKFALDTSGIIFVYYTLKELKQMTSRADKPIRYIQIEEIIDYWNMARVSLKYAILLPKTIHNFIDKEYYHLFEYRKLNGSYVLLEPIRENGWGRIEQQ